MSQDLGHLILMKWETFASQIDLDRQQQTCDHLVLFFLFLSPPFWSILPLCKVIRLNILD